MEGYKTKQKEIILNYLEQNSNKDLTADMIVNYIIKKNKKCSQTTVYRYLKQLVSEGIVRKYYIDNNTSSCYQYIKNGECKEHLHFKCEKCGKTLHLNNYDTSGMEEYLNKEYNVQLNPSHIVLYGICGECNK